MFIVSKNVHTFSFIIVIYFSNLYVNKYKIKILLEINSLQYNVIDGTIFK